MKLGAVGEPTLAIGDEPVEAAPSEVNEIKPAKALASDIWMLIADLGKLVRKKKIAITDVQRIEFVNVIARQWRDDLLRAGTDGPAGATEPERTSFRTAAKGCRAAAREAARLRLEVSARDFDRCDALPDPSALHHALADLGTWREEITGEISEARNHAGECRDRSGRVLPATEMRFCVERRNGHRDFRSHVGRQLTFIGLALPDIDLRAEPDPEADLISERIVYASRPETSPNEWGDLEAAHLDRLAVNLTRAARHFESLARPGKKAGRKPKWQTRRLLRAAASLEVTNAQLAGQIADSLWDDKLPKVLGVNLGDEGEPGSREWRVEVLSRHFGTVRKERRRPKKRARRFGAYG